MASGEAAVIASPPGPTRVAEQFDDPAQQEEASTFGMWVFLATEVLLFGGFFLSYVVYRHFYPAAFRLGSARTDYWLGTINTGVLLTSSLTMALAVQAAKTGRRRLLLLLLGLTAVLGVAFIGIKGYEWYKEFGERLAPGAGFDYAAFPADQARYVEMFFVLYFFMTGLHAIHLTVAVGLVLVMMLLALLGHVGPRRSTPVELTGLFWHLVDVVWVFLYPLLYLVGPRS
jgi:cytochrome c oxidase subunit 3